MAYRNDLQSIGEIEKEASSKAIYKTISELDTLLEGDRICADGKLRSKLHKKLFELLRSVTISWYKRGFKRGHKTSYQNGEKVPKLITKKMKIKAPYFSKNWESVILKSEIKKKIKIKNKKV